jgi:hypothetical protein
MPARDFYHDIVRAALENEGWVIHTIHISSAWVVERAISTWVRN